MRLIYRLFHPNFYFTPTSTTLRGFDSEQIQGDRIQRIDRILILNVANIVWRAARSDIMVNIIIIIIMQKTEAGLERPL